MGGYSSDFVLVEVSEGMQVLMSQNNVDEAVELHGGIGMRLHDAYEALVQDDQIARDLPVCAQRRWEVRQAKAEPGSLDTQNVPNRTADHPEHLVVIRRALQTSPKRERRGGARGYRRRSAGVGGPGFARMEQETGCSGHDPVDPPAAQKGVVTSAKLRGEGDKPPPSRDEASY